MQRLKVKKYFVLISDDGETKDEELEKGENSKNPKRKTKGKTNEWILKAQREKQNEWMNERMNE